MHPPGARSSQTDRLPRPFPSLCCIRPPRALPGCKHPATRDDLRRCGVRGWWAGLLAPSACCFLGSPPHASLQGITRSAGATFGASICSQRPIPQGQPPRGGIRSIEASRTTPCSGWPSAMRLPALRFRSPCTPCRPSGLSLCGGAGGRRFGFIVRAIDASWLAPAAFGR